jgi:adenosylhomocysteine nucleosidase
MDHPALEPASAPGRPLTGPVLVCFAVKDEARFFKPCAEDPSHVRSLLTGMGRRNAERALREALGREQPRLVVSSGFAGGLNPDLALGAVVFGTAGQTGLEPALRAAGAQPARFHCAERVVVTAEEKRALRATTGADAVEMESQVINALCAARQIPSLTVRVILDAAADNLPLDFNQLMNAEQQLSSRKLALALMRSPSKIGALLRFQQQCESAARKLAEVLKQVLAL